MIQRSKLRFSLLFTAALALVIGIGAGLLALRRVERLAASSWLTPSVSGLSLQVAQDSGDDEGDEVPPEEVDKYVRVYQAMQRDRSLTVEQAAGREKLSVQDFRDIERRVERDDSLRERVRRELLRAAQEKSNLSLPPHGASPAGH